MLITCDEECKNNLDENGYIEGIELTLPKNKFLSLIRNYISFRILATAKFLAVGMID